MSGKLKINPFVSKSKPRSQKPIIEIYVDGASLGNPGFGGAGVVILTTANGERQRTAFGAYLGDNETNNRAEITAAILSLQRLNEPSQVTLFSDSEYVINTVTKGWKKNKNQDLWAELEAAAEKHDVTWKWVRGHAGDEFNELAHTLADLAADEQRDVTEDDIPAPIVTDGVNSTTLEALLEAAVSGEGILTLGAEAGVVFASLQMADGDLTLWRSIGDVDLSDTSQSLFERSNDD